MNVFRVNGSTFLGEAVIEGYSSLIWTERYLPAGEFELRTPLVDQTRSLIPEDSLISHTDTAEVMIVETHEIERTDNGDIELVVKGRTFETILEQRFFYVGGYRDAIKMRSTYPPHGAALALIYNSIIHTGPWDLIATQPNTVSSDPKDVIPNVQMTESQGANLPWQEWWIEPGEIYTMVVDFLGRGGYGIRNVRRNFPMLVGGQMRLSDPEGYLMAEPDPGEGLLIDVYGGKDRTKNQTTLPVVNFSYIDGHLEAPKYLFSNKNLKNVAQVISDVGDVFVYLDNAVSPYLTGRDRRMLLVDGGRAGDTPLATFTPALVQKGEIELAKYNRIASMASAISVSAPYRYKLDYDLGDKVTLAGEFGFEASMQVIEYVRTEDANGDRGFPTLALPT